MKKTACLLALFSFFTACDSSNKESGNNQQKTFNTTSTENIDKERRQEIKNLNPSYVHVLDFSDRAKAEWTLRDTLLGQLSTGKKDWDKLTSEEEALLEKYDEVFEDIWDILGGGCSWYCGGGSKEVTASSYLKSQSSNNYEPKNAHDLNYKSAWVEGVPGYGKGEYLMYTFEGKSPRITEIIVVPISAPT